MGIDRWVDPAASGTATAHSTTGDMGFLPTDHSYLAWTYDPMFVNLGIALVAGFVVLTRLTLRASMTVTNMHTYVSTAGITISNSYVALYDNAATNANRLGGTPVDQSASWVSTGYKTVAIPSGPLALAAGTYWMGFIVGAASTAVQLGKFNAVATGVPQGSLIRSASSTSGLTALPTTFPNPPTGTTYTSGQIWAAVS